MLAHARAYGVLLGMRQTLYTTDLTVDAGDKTYAVAVTSRGYFQVTTDDGSEIKRDTFERLTEYFRGVAQRKAAKARREHKALPTTVMNGVDAVDVDIHGLTDNGRLLYKGMAKGDSLGTYQLIYARFSPEVRARFTALRATLDEATRAFNAFLDEQPVYGYSQDVAKAVEDGTPPSPRPKKDDRERCLRSSRTRF